MNRDTISDPLAVFVTLVSDCQSPLEAIKSDLAALYTHLSMPSVGACTMAAVRDHQRSRLRSVLVRPEGDWDRDCLHTMQRELIMRHELDELPLQPALRLLELIDYVTRDACFPHFEDTEVWRTAIGLCSDLYILGDVSGAEQIPIETLRPREVNVGRAALFLRERGATVSIREAQVRLSEDDSRRIAGEILGAIEKLGGFQFASAVFSMLAYDTTQKRYHLAPPTSTTTEYRPPSIPFGYLLHLAVRATQNARVDGVPEQDAPALFGEVFALSSALVAAYDVERYSPWDAAFQTASTLLPFARRLAIAYGSFSLTQMRPTDVERLLRGVFDWVNDTDVTLRCGFSIANAITAAATILDGARNIRGPFGFTRDQIANALPATVRGDIDQILAAFTHDAGANSDFLLPEEATKETFSSRPLIRHRDGAFVLLDGSWCAPAFYEALASVVRDEFGPGIDKEIGLAIERFLKREFEGRHIDVTRGTYVSKGEAGECDGVFETESHVIFYEAKKKALRRASRAGSQMDLIIDLSKSLVAAQVQLGNHEIRLMEQSQLEIDDEGVTKAISLSDREVERIALTLQDYGLFQDRLVIDRILRIVTGSKFRVTPAELQTKLDELTTLGAELLDQYTRIAALDQSRHEQPFFNCWFLSVPQILVVLDGVDSADGFWARIRSVRHVTTGRLDFYADLALAESIKNS